jgi:formylglycine-generating enzyme required for sulfatase activity
MVRAAVIVLLIALFPSHARADGRIALLIGNEAYTSEIGRLANPHNDVALLEQALKGLGFEVVTVRDAGLGALNRAVNGYARHLQAAGPNAIGFFYYSGHGASDGNTNYLIPVDVKTAETGELWDESLRLTEITRRLKAEAGNATHFVVFDACRNTLRLTQPGSRAVVQSKGFVPVAQENGMLIAYATAEGELATDVGAGAGPYAKVLAEEIVKPGIEAVVMFRAVQRRVRVAIRQEPYLGFNALGDIYLAGKSELLTATSQSGWSPTEREWQQYGKDTKDIHLLEAFKEKHKADPVYARLAEARIEELRKQSDKDAMLRCNLLTNQGQFTCTADPSCAWHAVYRYCHAKMHVAIATPPTPPASPTLKEEPAVATTPARCDGIEIAVGKNERRCFKPGAGKTEYFKDCPTCPEMVVVPAGTFTMGSPTKEPERENDPIYSKGSENQISVTIAKLFAAGRFAVTRGEFAAFVAATRQKIHGWCIASGKESDDWRSPGFGQTDRHPVVCVTWEDASAYLEWLSSTTGKTYRLLSDAEREYVTRAGTTTPFWWGSDISPKQANYNGEKTYLDGSPKGQYRRATVPVDSFAANPWGLYNVHGNVSEWTEDCWTQDNTGNPADGTARLSGDCTFRVIRGGSWIASPDELRAAFRRRSKRDTFRFNTMGFRVARTLAP